MGRSNSKVSKLLDVAKTMPPLYHTIPNEMFDIEKSEVVQWLIKQPDILNYVVNRIKSSGLIIYDSQSGVWEGVDYDGN